MSAEWERLFAHRISVSGNCWLFTGARNKAGYGKMAYTGINTTAHRISWAVANGQPLPRGHGLVVMHHCDTPACVRPSHVDLVTASTNTRDMIAKRRHGAALHPERITRGERHNWYGPRASEESHGAKLTWETARQIRALRRDGTSISALIVRYGMSRTAIYDVLAERTWPEDGTPSQLRAAERAS